MEWLNLIQCLMCSGPIRPDGGGVFRCTACYATYPAAGSVPDFVGRSGDVTKEVEVDYDYHLRRRHGSLRRLYNRFCRSLELQLIRGEADRLGRPLDMLDVGCGDPTRSNGTYHAQLFPLARVYIGIEPSQPLASRVRPLPSVGLVRANGELRVLRDEVVDIALSFRALDRCVDPSRVLANMATALRPGGCILIKLVNEDVWYKAISNRVRKMLARRSPPPRRRSKMSPDDLKQLLESLGFQDVELYDFFYLSGPLQSKALDRVVALLGERLCAAMLRQVDRLGRLIAPRRGGMFLALARKPQQLRWKMDAVREEGGDEQAMNLGSRAIVRLFT